jgi:uncharacterized phage-like protein YoqJ
MPHESSKNQNSNQHREELKILITGDKPKNLLDVNSQSGAAAYSKTMTDLFEAVSERALAQIVKDNPGRKIVLLSGLELGIEQAAARRALEMGVEARAFIPYKEHGKNWSDEFQKRYRDLLGEIAEKGGSVVSVSDKEYSPQRAQLRDYRMIDEAQTVVSLHNPNAIPAHQKTLDYAAKHSKGIINVWNDAEKRLAEISKNFSDPRERNFTPSSIESPKIMTDSQTQNQESRKIEIRERITRQDLHAEPDKIFLFGDNLKQAGYGGQAKEMRGEKNAAGIPTKKEPSNKEESFFTDKEFDANKKAIDQAFDKIPPGKTIVIPRGGIGTGLARLEEKAPQTFAYLNSKLSEIGFDNRRGREIVANVQTGGNKVTVQNSSDSPISRSRLLDLNDIKTENLSLLSPTSKEIDALKIDRAEALNAYAERLRRDYKANKGFLRDGLKTVSDALDKGEQITVACNCRNGAMCHADVVKMAIEKINFHVKNQQIQETSRNENLSRSVQANAKNDFQKIENGLNPRTQRAIAEILGTSETDKLLERINQTDGRNQSEQASHLGKYSQFVRDIYERGGTMAEGKLIVPKENLSLAPQLAVTTESYAVERIGKILNDESRAKEIAPQIVEYGNRIAGLSTSDGETKLKVFAWMYDALEGKSVLLGGDPHNAQIGESRRDRFDNVLENIARLAEQMQALEPADKIEFAPLSDFEPNEKSGSVWEERDENRVLEEIYENAVGRDADGEAIERGEQFGEEIQNGERGFDSQEDGKIAGAEGYERIDLSDKAPSLPAEFTEPEIERLLAETLPEIDRQLESGIAVKEIIKPFHENVRHSAQIDALNRLETIYQKQKISEIETKLGNQNLSAAQKEKLESELSRRQSLVLTPSYDAQREILAGVRENEFKGKTTIVQASGKTGNLSENVKEQILEMDVRLQNVIELRSPGEFFAAHETAEKTFYQKTKTEIANLRSELEEVRENKENYEDKTKEIQLKKQLNDLRELKPSIAFKLKNSSEIIVGRASANAIEERAFVYAYVNFQLKQLETRLRHENERYRDYAARLENAATRSDVIKVASDIRAENAALGLKWKNLEAGEKEKLTKPLTNREMQFLFTETSPAHYTPEMTVARLAYAHSGESRRQLTEALLKGEIKPSSEAQKLIDSLESRLTRRELKDSMLATKHFFESLKTPNENLRYKNAFCHQETYRMLPPQERDFVYLKATHQKENLEYRLAFRQQDLIKNELINREQQPKPEQSKAEKSFYLLSAFNQARILGERIETSPLASKEISERDFLAANVILQNHPQEKISNLSFELKQNKTIEDRKIGEILETFAQAKVTKSVDKTAVEIKVPENSLLEAETYKELLERFYSDDKSENDKFRFSAFHEKTLEDARIKGQDEAIRDRQAKLGDNFYVSQTPAAHIFQTERALAEDLLKVAQMQQAARAARSENARILEKYASRAALKLENQKLTAPSVADQKQIVKIALEMSGKNANLTSVNSINRQFFAATQTEITINDFQKFSANEKIVAESQTSIRKTFSEIAVKENVLEQNRFKSSEIRAEDKLAEIYFNTQKTEENRLLTVAARTAFNEGAKENLEGKSIGELVAETEKREIKSESLNKARIALEPAYKDFDEKDYNEQALKLADAIEKAHDLSKEDAPQSEIAEAFEIAENKRAVLRQTSKAVEKLEDKPFSLRLYEAEIKRAEKELWTKNLGAKILAGIDYSETGLTLNLDKIFSADEREQIKLQAAEIAKERLEPKELDADHRKVSAIATRQALLTFKSLEQAHNVYKFTDDKTRLIQAFSELDREAGKLNKIRQEYNRAEKLTIMQSGVKTDLIELLSKNSNITGKNLVEETKLILSQNLSKIGLSQTIIGEQKVTILSQEIVDKIGVKQKAAAKENSDFKRNNQIGDLSKPNVHRDEKIKELHLYTR